MPITQRTIILLIKLYLKTWINIILKERHCYPSHSFELRNCFGISCPWSRHPGVISWIETWIDDVIGVEPIMGRKNGVSLVNRGMSRGVGNRVNRGMVKKGKGKGKDGFEELWFVQLSILNHRDKTVKERYVIDFREFYKVVKLDLEISDIDIDGGLEYKDVYDEIRGNIFSLLKRIRSLNNINGDGYEVGGSGDGGNEGIRNEFIITVETSKGVCMGDDWGLDDDNDYIETKPQILPLRTIDIGPMLIYSSIETYNNE